jgi:hypothetical protein
LDPSFKKNNETDAARGTMDFRRFPEISNQFQSLFRKIVKRAIRQEKREIFG